MPSWLPNPSLEMPADAHLPVISNPPPKVSVAMITYNHEKFIAQAIESVLMQETDFQVELVIGEDCSKDKTRLIVQDYARKHPDRIRLLLHAANVGPRVNSLAVLNACQGEYIACLEGDDYWTSPHKLQRQVIILDKNPNAAFCYHNTNVVFDGNSSKNYLSHPEPPSEITIYDVLKRWSIMSSSIVLRKDFLLPLPSWAIEISEADYMIQMLLAARGSVIYVNEVMSVYRRHAGGLSSMFADPVVYAEHTIRLYRYFNIWSKGEYRATIFHQMSGFYLYSAMHRRLPAEFGRFIHDAFLHFRYFTPFNLVELANSVRQLFLPKSWNNYLSGTRVFKSLKGIYRRVESGISRHV